MTYCVSISEGQFLSEFEKVYNMARRHFNKKLRICGSSESLSKLCKQNYHVDMIEYYINMILSKYNAKFTFISGILEFDSQEDAIKFLLRWT